MFSINKVPDFNLPILAEPSFITTPKSAGALLEEEAPAGAGEGIDFITLSARAISASESI